ncbi:MAG TPA: nuclear transport factor 2 family protein [Solirubrobacteraceae bacterium]|jgi:ketosteroid isomerase-like protein|nr:nuclear transport factor 2 family protein [Solirubrobacteraceae bacterium]
MSQQNVELVERLIDAFNRRDVDAFAEITTPDFEWTTSVMAVEGEIFWGREGIDTYFERMRDAWDEFRGLADEVRDLGERVLWSGRLKGRGRVSGVPVNTPLDVLYDFHGGKISRMHSFLDHDEALRAAGLSE